MSVLLCFVLVKGTLIEMKNKWKTKKERRWSKNAGSKK
jgi:hypothetical protein